MDVVFVILGLLGTVYCCCSFNSLVRICVGGNCGFWAA